MRTALLLLLVFVFAHPAPASAQDDAPCRFICELQLKFEPTWTTENLAHRHRLETVDGQVATARRERTFEAVLALDVSTRLPRLGFTVEAIAQPFADDNEVELEFESTFIWLPGRMTRGWVTSHFDVVDQFSHAERPGTSRAYTHKLDFELDTALHLFKRLPATRWLSGVELEISLDYLATGTPRKGDLLGDGSRLLDDASRWSLSTLLILPLAPF